MGGQRDMEKQAEKGKAREGKVGKEDREKYISLKKNLSKYKMAGICE